MAENICSCRTVIECIDIIVIQWRHVEDHTAALDVLLLIWFHGSIILQINNLQMKILDLTQNAPIQNTGHGHSKETKMISPVLRTACRSML